MKKVFALLALPLLTVCSASEQAEELNEAAEVPDSVSEESLSAWTIQVADSAEASAFQVVLEGDDLSVDARSQGIAWRPVDQVLGGDFEVSARFEPRELSTSLDDVYGIIVGGKNLSDPDRSYSYYLVRPNGEHQIGRLEGAETHTLIEWKTVEPAAPATESLPADLKLSVRVVGEQVDFLLGETVVATLPRSDVQPHGIAGVQVGANATVSVRDWQVEEPEREEVKP
jgi:hypothetical protein